MKTRNGTVRRITKVRRNIILAGIIALLLFAGLVYLVTKPRKSSAPTTVTPMVRTEVKNFGLNSGWFNSKTLSYYDFGTNAKRISTVYQLVTGFESNGNPQFVSDQGAIFDSKPGDESYSDFRRIQYATVPSDYQTNSVKSVSEIASKGWPTKDSGSVSNMPQVLQGDTITPDRPKSSGWVNGEQVYYWQFEKTVPANPDNSNEVKNGSLYAFITGYDPMGNPLYLSDQRPIFSSAPSEQDYSPLWQIIYVEAPATYQANSIQSVDGVRSSGYTTTDSGVYVNHPIYDVAGTVYLPVAVQQVQPQTPGTQPEQPAQQPAAQEKPKSTTGAKTAPQKTQTSTPKQQPKQVVSTPLPTAPPVLANLAIANFAYQPNPITIPVGSTVFWTNGDPVPHTVTADDGRIDSGILPPGGHFQIIFTEPGVFTYHDALCPNVRGQIVIQ